MPEATDKAAVPDLNAELGQLLGATQTPGLSYDLGEWRIEVAFPAYDASRDLMAGVEEELERRGLSGKYGQQLAELVSGHQGVPIELTWGEDFFALAHAPADLRAGGSGRAEGGGEGNEGMRIGFTGTREGITTGQKQQFHRLIIDEMQGIAEFHHGDCVGSDDCAATMMQIARKLKTFHSPCVRIVVHPPKNGMYRAFNHHGDEAREPKSYLARNRDIVDETDLLIGTPAQMEHQPSGGTWYTLDYAAKNGKRCIIIFPDGSVTDSAAGSAPTGGDCR